MSASEPVVIASDQSAVPVSGTVTANLSATDNAVLDQIELNQDSQTAILTTIDADTGAMVTDLAAIEVLLGTIDADTGAIKTAVEVIDNAIAGTEMQVDVVAPLPAGTNNIGDVDVLTLPAITGTVTANLSATDNAVLDQIELNQDTQTAVLNTIDADTGAMVTDLAAIEVLLGTIDADTGAIATAVQLIDDTIHADDAAYTLGTSKASVIAGVAVNMDGTDPTGVSAEGDAAALRTDPNRLLLVNQTHPRFWHVSADYASAQTNTSVKAAPGASLSLYITDLQISNGATAGNVTLLDGSGGTVLYELYPAINGGAVLSLRNPIKLTANTALCITSTTVTTHSVFVSGYIAA